MKKDIRVGLRRTTKNKTKQTKTKHKTKQKQTNKKGQGMLGNNHPGQLHLQDQIFSLIKKQTNETKQKQSSLKFSC